MASNIVGVSGRAMLEALIDGSCLDDPDKALPVYATRLTADGHVEVGA